MRSRSQVQSLEFGQEFGYAPTETGSEDLRGLPEFASNSWHTGGAATGHAESNHARYSPSPSRGSGGYDDFPNGAPVPSHGAHSRSSRVLSTMSAPLMRSVSRDSRVSDATSDQIRSNDNYVRKESKTTTLLNSLLDASAEYPIDAVHSPPGSVTSHPRLDHPSSTGQRRILNPNATSQMLSTALADVSQAITSVAHCFKAGTLDEAQMQMIVQTSLLNLIGSQASGQRLPRSQSSTRSAPRGGQIWCDECNKSVARHCDMKYVHIQTPTSRSTH